MIGVRITKNIKTLYHILSKEFGSLTDWWPAETHFERIAGAILVQQTRWENVDRVISVLKDRDLMSPETIVALPLEELEQIVRPAGFYRNKAKSLKAVAQYFMENPVEGISKKPQHKLRQELLGLRGIGNETADVIMLYVAGKPSFVIDAYTRKLCGCLEVKGSYAELQRLFEKGLPRHPQIYQHYHALIVEHGKRYCNKKACVGCGVKKLRSGSRWE
jgi:endonuclease-3 related protein